jgi:hypothetical protein
MTDVLHRGHASTRDVTRGSTVVPERIVADPPASVRMVDVVREIQAIALAAERMGDPGIMAACRRVQSLLARLRNDFVEDLIGDTPPSEGAA